MSVDIHLYAPEKCPHCGGVITGGDELFWQNITHNLIPMWRKAGVLEAIYESDGHQAKEYLDVLRKGIADFEANYSEYEKLNSPNGWGLASNALPWLKRVLEAFEANPEAIIRVSK